MKDKIRLTFITYFVWLVIRKGFEPLTHSLEGCCSIQLSYRTIADCTGLEPVNSTVTGWHDNQLHQQSIEPKDGIEPPTY